MKRIAFSSTLVLIVTLMLSGCIHGVRGSGVRKTEPRALEPFTAIETSGAFQVDVICQKPASFEIDSTGAGKIDAHDLQAEKADVNVTGAAAVDVSASDQLDVTVSGAGRVTYSGNPKVNKRVSGAGQVKKKESTGV